MCRIYKSTATQGFVVAGIYQIVSILGFNQFFTNRILNETDPIVFSTIGQVLLLLFGLVYLWLAKKFTRAPLLVGLLSFTNFLYAGAWFYWLLTSPEKLDALAGQSMLLFSFFSSYGFAYFLFGCFCAMVAINTRKGRYGSIK